MATNYDIEQRAMDAAIRDERRGSGMQTLGWVFIIFDLIPAVWLWVGWRSGSMFWFWWVLGEGLSGVALLIAGTILRSKAARDFAAYERGRSGPKAA
ncbi:MAG: hypothetical protein ACE14M_15365 [Terriglobales bacterium]